MRFADYYDDWLEELSAQQRLLGNANALPKDDDPWFKIQFLLRRVKETLDSDFSMARGTEHVLYRKLRQELNIRIGPLLLQSP